MVDVSILPTPSTHKINDSPFSMTRAHFLRLPYQSQWHRSFNFGCHAAWTNYTTHISSIGAKYCLQEMQLSHFPRRRSLQGSRDNEPIIGLIDWLPFSVQKSGRLQCHDGTAEARKQKNPSLAIKEGHEMCRKKCIQWSCMQPGGKNPATRPDTTARRNTPSHHCRHH